MHVSFSSRFSPRFAHAVAHAGVRQVPAVNTATSDERHMRQAIAMSARALARQQYPIAAQVVSPEGRVVASSTNTVLDAKAPLGGTPLGHAEISAIYKACKLLGTPNLRGYTLVSTCQPCPMCLGAMYYAGIRNYAYGASVADTAELKFHRFPDRRFYEDLQKPPEERLMKGRQVLRDEAYSVLTQWQNQVQAGTFAPQRLPASKTARVSL